MKFFASIFFVVFPALLAKDLTEDYGLWEPFPVIHGLSTNGQAQNQQYGNAEITFQEQPSFVQRVAQKQPFTSIYSRQKSHTEAIIDNILSIHKQTLAQVAQTYKSFVKKMLHTQDLLQQEKFNIQYIYSSSMQSMEPSVQILHSGPQALQSQSSQLVQQNLKPEIESK